MNINIVLSDKHKKKENILELYYDKFEIENIMNQNIQKQHYFVIISVILMIMILFSIIFIITTVMINHQNYTQYKNEQCKLLIKKHKKLNFNYIKNI
jgi:hypothetical protein